jgi:hypothetical protein
MYAHQVIEDLKYYYRNKDEEKGIIDHISNSQKFHFDINDESYSSFNDDYNNHHQNLDIMGYNINFPYDNCWFDLIYLEWGLKIGFLISKIDFLSEFRVYVFIKSLKTSPYSIVGFSSPDYPYVKPFHSLTNYWNLLPEAIAIADNDFNNIETAPNAITWVPDGDLYYKDKNYCSFVKVYFTFCLYCLTLLSCKNIAKKENKPPEKLNKKRIKNGKLPLFSYYTLHIKDSGNSNSKNVLGDHNRIHLCRGHFKHYTEDNPLFGKLTGMYWWQPHVRGQNKDGIIMKDYSLDASNLR